VTLDEFAMITQRVIARDGFDEFQPTACYPARRQLAVLSGVPPHVDIESASTSWALKNASSNEEVLVAFRIAAARFKIVRIAEGLTEEGHYDIA
jgi:hypothetical protein